MSSAWTTSPVTSVGNGYLLVGMSAFLEGDDLHVEPPWLVMAATWHEGDLVVGILRLQDGVFRVERASAVRFVGKAKVP